MISDTPSMIVVELVFIQKIQN